MKVLELPLRFVARNRFALAITCLAAALFVYRYQLELDPLPRHAIEIVDVEAHAIGALEIQVRGRRDAVAVARRDAGYAVEYTPQPNVSSLGPFRKLFAPELALTDAEIRWIRGHGPSYRLGIARQQIVTIESKTQPLIRYERYSSLAAAKRDNWRIIGALTVVLGVTLFAVGHWHRVKTGA